MEHLGMGMKMKLLWPLETRRYAGQQADEDAREGEGPRSRYMTVNRNMSKYQISINTSLLTFSK